MRITKSTLLTVTIFIVISMSFLPVFGLENTFTNTDSNDILPNISGNPIPTLNTIKLSGSANYAYGLNATASVNRTVEIESYGVVSIILVITLLID